MLEQIQLRDTTEDDLPILFEQQLDPEANRLAAFTARDPSDGAAFTAHWTRILGDDAIVTQTILCDGQVAGNILSFEHFGKPSVGYWLGREFWGRGIATRALQLFLRRVTTRPLYAGAAKDNLASLRVLEKCGFKIVGEACGYARARGEDVEEYLLELPDRPNPERPNP